MLDAVRLRPTQLNATARRRYLPVRRVAIRRLPCGAACAVSGSAEPCTPAGTSGKTWNPAGTWAAACPWRRRLVRGCLHPVPSDGAESDWRATVGLHVGIQPARVPCRVQRHGPFSGAPRRLLAAFSRTALRALPSALVGVQPATVLALRPSNAGKVAVSSRHALPLRRVASSVRAKRVLTTPGMPRPARSPSLSAGTTAGQRALTLDDCRTALGVSTRPLQDQTRSCLQPLTRCQQAR